MKSRVQGLIEEIHRLEAELEQAIETQEEQFLLQLEGTKDKFEDAIAEVQSKLKQDVLVWLKESELRNGDCKYFCVTAV